MNEAIRVELEVVTYSLVGARRSDAEFLVKCIHAKDLDEAVRRRFSAYAVRCRAQDFHDVVFQSEAGLYLKGKLTRLLTLPVEQGDAERCDITQELAARLSERMNASGASTAPGALFAIQACFNGDRCVVLVKLDLGAAGNHRPATRLRIVLEGLRGRFAGGRKAPQGPHHTQPRGRGCAQRPVRRVQ